MNYLNPENLAQYIDHTLLKPQAQRTDIIQLCAEADKYSFASVCINPCYVKLAAEHLKDSKVKVCTVIDFPLGASSPEIKAAESIKAVADGAEEIDMVLNVGAMKSGDYNEVKRGIEYVRNSVPAHILLKVILETCFLTKEEIIKAGELSLEAGADYIKTSTGFGTDGATVEHVTVMKEVARDKMKVKASGGIRDYDKAVAMINSGASRIGTSSGIKIIGA